MAMRFEELERRVAGRKVRELLQEVLEDLKTVKPGARSHALTGIQTPLAFFLRAHKETRPAEETILDLKRRTPKRYNLALGKVHDAMKEFGVTVLGTPPTQATLRRWRKQL